MFREEHDPRGVKSALPICADLHRTRCNPRIREPPDWADIQNPPGVYGIITVPALWHAWLFDQEVHGVRLVLVKVARVQGTHFPLGMHHQLSLEAGEAACDSNRAAEPGDSNADRR
jgi:hypothetical protein